MTGPRCCSNDVKLVGSKGNSKVPKRNPPSVRTLGRFDVRYNYSATLVIKTYTNEKSKIKYIKNRLIPTTNLKQVIFPRNENKGIEW